MYLDEKGLIMQSNGDEGDTLQREGFWYEGRFFNNTYMQAPGMASYSTAINLLWSLRGFVRSWKPGTSTPPWNTPSDCSRDQLVSNIRALGYYKMGQPLRSIFDGVIKNISRYPNGDIAFINDYGRFIRSFNLWYLYPLLWVFDIPILLNSIIRIIAGKDFNNVGDDINHIGDLQQAKAMFPTPISFMARKLYKWLRPNFARQQGLLSSSGPQYALDWYFRKESGANPEFAELWAPIVKGF